MSEGLRCKDCGAPIDRTIQFCTACGVYLGWSEASTDQAEVETAPTAEAPAPAPAAAGGKACPSCGTTNPASRTFCSHCGTALELVQTEQIPVVSQPKVRRRVPVVPLIALAVVLIAVGLLLATRGGDDAEPVASSEEPVSTTVAPATTSSALRGPKRIDPATITASASSTLPDDPPYNYSVKNTLDGNLETAWNDGAPGAGAGEKLTYRFSAPVDITQIGLVNGYASTPELFKENARIRNLVIVTDFARFPVTLPDSATRQELNLPFGRTASVVLEVVSVYPGSKYDDLALTEIDFSAA